MKNEQHNSSQRRRGYTLMEIMVVLALIAIASALVMPSIARGFGSAELRLAASSTATAFKQARMHAVYESRSFVVVFGPQENHQRDLYVIRDDGKTAEHVTLNGDIQLLAEQHGDWAGDIQPVHFFPDGHSEAMQLDMQNPRGQHLQLALDPLTARARVTQIYGGAIQSPVSSAPESGDSGVTVIGGGR